MERVALGVLSISPLFHPRGFFNKGDAMNSSVWLAVSWFDNGTCQALVTEVCDLVHQWRYDGKLSLVPVFLHEADLVTLADFSDSHDFVGYRLAKTKAQAEQLMQEAEEDSASLKMVADAAEQSHIAAEKAQRERLAAEQQEAAERHAARARAAEAARRSKVADDKRKHDERVRKDAERLAESQRIEAEALAAAKG